MVILQCFGTSVLDWTVELVVTAGKSESKSSRSIKIYNGLIRININGLFQL